MSERPRSPLHSHDIEVASCTPSLRKEILGSTPVFRGLHDAALSKVNDAFSDVGFDRGQLIVREGDSATKLFVVATGVVKLFRHAESGETVLLDVLGAGELFGSLSAYGPEAQPDSVEAQTPCCILVIESERFRRIVETYPSVALKLVEVLSGRLRDTSEMLRQLSGYPADQRLAYVLLVLARKLGEPSEGRILIQAPLRREELAGMAGVTTETASRILSRWRTEGLIDSGRGWVALVDREALSDLAPDFSV